MTPQILLSEQLQVLLLYLVPGLPLVVALTLLVPPFQRISLILAPWSALPALAAALLIKPGIDLKVPWFFMGGRMGLDLLGQRFLLLAALVWLLSAFYGYSYLRKDPRRYYFFFFYMASMAFNFGLILAQDMLGFYLFFCLMSFSAYGLIIHARSKEAWQAGKIYIILVMVGEMLLFSGMLLMASRLPDLELNTIAGYRSDNLSLILIYIGFAIKAGVFPLHVWLPLAHPVAPVPASAVLSGVMIKAGLLGWLRFLPVGPDIFLPGWGTFFVVLGICAAFYGVVLGLLQQEAKTILAYSSISQVGLMTMIVGCGLLSPAFWPQVKNAVSIYALHHGLAKASLFLGTGLVKDGGMDKQAPWLMVLLLLPSLALAGLPFTSGAIAKFTVKEIVHEIPMQWAAFLEFVLPLSAFATTVLLFHFLRILYRTLSQREAISVGMLFPWLGLLIAVIGLLWVIPTQPRYVGHLLELDLIWQGVWPIVLGCGVMFSHWKWWPDKKSWSVPAGDILWFFWGSRKERLDVPEKKVFSTAAKEMHNTWQARMIRIVHEAGRKIEKRFMRWVVVGSCYLCIFFVFLFLIFTN